MAGDTEVLVGAPEGDHVLISVCGREREGSADYWDANWVDCDIQVRSGGFEGAFSASLRAEDFSVFRQSIASLYESLTGEATFDAMEQQLAFTLVGNGRGGIAVTGTALDQPGIGNALAFHFDLDQTFLPAIIAGLDGVVARYPVVGSPSD